MEGYDRGDFAHGWPYWPRERMRLQPHGFTVLIQPDAPPERTDSGLIVMPDDKDYIATSGTVVAVGKGSKRLWEARKKAYRKVLMALDASHFVSSKEALRVRDLANGLLDEAEPLPSVSVGERVVFPAESGLTVKDEDGTDYVLIEEDKIAIIVEESVA